MAILTRMIALSGLAVVLVATPSGEAQTQADFDACNQAARASSPSASPRTLPGTAGGGSTMTSPGSTDANRQPNATGRISGSAGSPGTGAGTTSGGASETISSGSRASSGAGADAQLRGRAAAGLADEAYQQAYRNCMTSRGF